MHDRGVAGRADGGGGIDDRGGGNGKAPVVRGGGGGNVEPAADPEVVVNRGASVDKDAGGSVGGGQSIGKLGFPCSWTPAAAAASTTVHGQNTCHRDRSVKTGSADNSQGSAGCERSNSNPVLVGVNDQSIGINCQRVGNG